jgi:hypothetical protein
MKGTRLVVRPALGLAGVAVLMVGLAAARPAGVRAETDNPGLPHVGVGVSLWDDFGSNGIYGDSNDTPLGSGVSDAYGIFSAGTGGITANDYGLAVGPFAFEHANNVKFQIGLWRNGQPTQPLVNTTVHLWIDTTRDGLLGGSDTELDSGQTNGRGDFQSDLLLVPQQTQIGWSVDVNTLPPGTTSVNGMLTYQVH